MTEPLRVRWDRTVIHSTGPGDDTIVCCLDQHGHPVALFLDDELREALALSLLDPNAEMDQADALTPQQCPAGLHADWAVDSENEHACPWCEADRLAAELVEHRRAVEYFDAQSKRHKEQRDQARAELATEQAKVRGVETVKCWTNEDGRRFVFAEDLAFALGYTPTSPAAPTT